MQHELSLEKKNRKEMDISHTQEASFGGASYRRGGKYGIPENAGQQVAGSSSSVAVEETLGVGCSGKFSIRSTHQPSTFPL
jgi:hypothetical protein